MAHRNTASRVELVLVIPRRIEWNYENECNLRFCVLMDHWSSTLANARLAEAETPPPEEPYGPRHYVNDSGFVLYTAQRPMFVLAERLA